MRIVFKSNMLLLLATAVTIVACVSNQSTSKKVQSCEIPAMYKEVYDGLIQPTWETLEQMLNQIEGFDASTHICWYGLPDGKIEARANPSESGFDAYIFEHFGSTWRLIEQHEIIIVQ